MVPVGYDGVIIDEVILKSLGPRMQICVIMSLLRNILALKKIKIKVRRKRKVGEDEIQKLILVSTTDYTSIVLAVTIRGGWRKHTKHLYRI